MAGSRDQHNAVKSTDGSIRIEHPHLKAANGHALPSPIHTDVSYPSTVDSSPVTSRDILRTALLLPRQEKSLSGISIRSFLLGQAFGISLLSALVLAYFQQRVWRVPFFLSSLALFHFLEYYVTARYNTQFGNVSAFLLSRNGRAYNIAHSTAMVECTVTSLFFPSWQARLSSSFTLAIGFAMLILGQAVRTIAMAHAGTNFNHTVQTRKSEGHRLVTDGIYRYLRHPSYFGFFWWGLGTQLNCGNVICFTGYVLVLWKFFRMRIMKEEEFLVEFFGDEYIRYKQTTRVGIPFVP